MKPTEQMLRTATLLWACRQIELEAADALKTTPLYKRRIKQLVNELTSEVEKEVGGYFRQMGSDEPAQQAFFRVQAAIERITEALIQTPRKRVNQTVDSSSILTEVVNTFLTRCGNW